MAALLSRTQALYVKMKQRYHSNCRGKERSITANYFVQQTRTYSIDDLYSNNNYNNSNSCMYKCVYFHFSVSVYF